MRHDLEIALRALMVVVSILAILVAMLVWKTFA